MGDLPPSYEAATGIPTNQPCSIDPATTKTPSAPSSGQTDGTQYTTTIPILPQTTLSSPQTHQLQPHQINASAPASIPMPQTNVCPARRRCRFNNSCKKSLCIIMAIVVVIVIGLIIALIAVKASRSKYKSDFRDTFKSIYGEPEYPIVDWEKINKNNQEFLERFNINLKTYQMPKFDID